MLPQDDISGSGTAPGGTVPLTSVCAEIRLAMNAVRDGRATAEERAFVSGHTLYCAGCASEWAFLRATKSAWAKTTPSVPSTSLAARIATATYRKPTFAERLVAVFAFLNPAPVRVAIGVAAVAGLSFFVLPRLAVVPDDVTPVAGTDSVPTRARELPTKQAEASPVAVVPTREVTPATKKTTPQPVLPVVKETPVLAAKPPAPEDTIARTVVRTDKPSPKVAPVAPKASPVQVARNTPKTARATPPIQTKSVTPDVTPSVREPENRIAVTATPAPAMPVSKPEVKSPVEAPVPVMVAGITAPDPSPDFADGSNRINGLSNTNQRPNIGMSGKLIRTASAADNAFIVSAETKL